jgi:hypothetical protein
MLTFMSSFFARVLFWLGVLVCASILPATAASQPMITLYAQDKYAGASVQLVVPASDLHSLGFANRTASFIIQSGTWQLCTAPNFSGNCITLAKGKYPAGYKSGFARTIVSVQPSTAAAH